MDEVVWHRYYFVKVCVDDDVHLQMIIYKPRQIDFASYDSRPATF